MCELTAVRGNQMLGHGTTRGIQPREKIVMRKVLRVGWVGKREPSVKKLLKT